MNLHRPPGLWALASGLAAVLSSVAAPLTAQGQTTEASLLELMAGANVPGLSIAIVADGEVVWDAALGVANGETAAPVTPETVFEAASLTKPVVAYTALRMVERGQLDLDTPLWDLLPYTRLESDAQSRTMTARHVLSHTTGLPNWARDRPLRTARPPGEAWGYSGEGFVYLQRVLEQLTGESLADLVQREVFEPLGMTSSSLVWRSDYDQLSAIGHDADANPAEKQKPEEANAAASLHTTAVDYGLFLGAVLSGRGLSPEMAVAMLSPVSQVGQARGGAEHANSLQWGLGWGLQNGDRSTAIWHWGDNGTFRSFVIGYPSQGRGLVYFTNSENGLTIAEDLVSRYFADTHHAIRWLDY